MRRALAALLVVVLLCVPSLTRVYQQLDHRSTPSTLTSSFSKSIDCPPTKVLCDMPEPIGSGALLNEPKPTIERARPIADCDPLRPAESAPPDALRAPPLA